MYPSAPIMNETTIKSQKYHDRLATPVINASKLLGFLCLLGLFFFNEFTYRGVFVTRYSPLDSFLNIITLTDAVLILAGILLLLKPGVSWSVSISKWVTKYLMLFMVIPVAALINFMFDDDYTNLGIAVLCCLLIGSIAWLMTGLKGYKMSLLTIVFLCLAVEVFFVIKESTGFTGATLGCRISRHFTEPDLHLGYRAIPGIETSVSHFWTLPDRIEYICKDVECRFDMKSRRWSGSRIIDAENHALFFGCSFTFGNSIPYEDSLPAAFEEISGNTFSSYNYGMEGWGTTQMYFLLQNPQYFSDVHQKSGIAVYSFIPDHIWRNIGSFHHMSGNASEFLLFRLKPDGSLSKPFRYYENRKIYFITRIHEAVVRSSPFLRDLNWSGFQPKFLPERDAVDIAIQLIRESKIRYDRLFDGDFWVILWPRLIKEMDPKSILYLKDRLVETGIQVLEVPALPPQFDAQIHPNDHHPSRDEYAWIAKHLLMAVESR
jgi:hypothetical protein